MSDISQLIDDCEVRKSRMNDWERAFIDSAKTVTEAGRTLTEKQKATLDKIWEKVTEKG
jgi:hypothetical protein